MTTFVLVHGSYQGGWIWQRVATRLRSAGHTVYAPTMDGVPSVGIGCARVSIHRPISQKPPTSCSPPREDTEKRLFADLDPATRAWVLDRDTPHPIGCSEIPMKLIDFLDQSWTATVIWCRRRP